MTLQPRQSLALFFVSTMICTASCLAPDAVPGDVTSGSAGQGAGGGSAGGTGPAGTGGDSGSGAGGSATAAELDWAKRYGVAEDFPQRALSVAASASDHVILAGAYVDSLTFEGLDPIPDTIGQDAFVADLDPAGKPKWAAAFSGFGNQRAFRAAGTEDGGAVVAGCFDGTLTYGGVDMGDTPQEDDGFVARIGPDQALKWLVRVHGPGNQVVHDLALTADGGVVIAGYFGDTLHVGALDGDSADFDRDFFVAKIDKAGAPLWTTSLAGNPVNLPAEQPSIVVAVAPDGTLRVAGTYVGSIGFDESLASVGARDVFVGALDAGGKPIWGRSIGAPVRQQRASGIAVNDKGHTMLAGDLRGSVSLPGGQMLSSSGDSDAFLVELDPGGELVWAKSYGSKAEDHGGPVALDASGNILFAGRFRGAISFGDGAPLMNSDALGGSDDIFLAKIAPDKSSLWSRAFGRELSQVPASVAVDSASHILLSGWFDGVVNFGDEDLDAGAGTDIFVAKFGK